MTVRRGAVSWVAVFVALFFLSLDFWTWSEPVDLGILNLPTWIAYFVVLQFLLAGAIHLFGRRYWTPKPPDDSRGDDE